jgi:hypothetical protein
MLIVANRSKPGSCFDQPVAPIITARQQAFWKIGGLSDPVSRRISVSPVLDDCFWGRCPGCNPPSVLSSICLIGEPAPPAENHRRLLPLSHRCRDPFHPQSQPSIKAPRERADHCHPDRARSRFCAPAQALTWHLLRSQRSPPCGWSFLKATTMAL